MLLLIIALILSMLSIYMLIHDIKHGTGNTQKVDHGSLNEHWEKLK